MAEPIITPGPVLIILPWIVALVCASFYLLIKERFSNVAIEEESRRAIITTAFFSLWTLIGFSYYLNRSYASGQMQILFLPLAVASASFFGYLFNQNSELPWKPRLNIKLSTWKMSSIKRNSSYLLISIIMSLPLSSIIAFPNPAIEIDRLTSSSPDHVWPKSLLVKTTNEVLIGKKFAQDNAVTISFFGASSNYMKIATGIESANILNSPWDIPVSSEAIEVGCSRIFNVNSDILILGEEGPALFRFKDSTLCDKYSMYNIENIREFRAARKLP